MIRTVDKSRIQYHKRYCKGYKNELSGKDLAVNSGVFGIQGSAEIIREVLQKKGY